LGDRLEALAANIDLSIADQSDIGEDVLRQFGHLESKIVATRALTLEGMPVKARAACWALWAIQPIEATCDQRMARSIVRYLIRLYDSHLELPGALEKLVAEITNDGG
jgi:hypothetical protein